jgi:opacity protein-like surface antigen
MKCATAALMLLAFLPAFGETAAVELAGYVGPALPSYRQSFAYTPPLVVPGVTGLVVEQSGAFRLDADGGVAVGAGLALYFAGPLGLEARFDTADVTVDVDAADFRARVDLPPPLPDLGAELDLGSGRVDLERVRALSLNLKIRTPGPIRLAASGGASYLPSLRLSASQPIALGITGLGGGTRLDVGTIDLRAEAAADEEDEGRFGLNAGAGVQIAFGESVALVAEGRYFVFQKRTLQWSRGSSRALSPIEEALLREVLTRLEPLEFTPTFFQATAGLAISF